MTGAMALPLFCKLYLSKAAHYLLPWQSFGIEAWSPYFFGPVGGPDWACPKLDPKLSWQLEESSTPEIKSNKNVMIVNGYIHV